MKRMFFENANLEFVNEYQYIASTDMLHVNSPLPKCQKLENVMLNSFQHLINSIYYETLSTTHRESSLPVGRQVQGDTNRFGQQPVNLVIKNEIVLLYSQ